MLSSYGIVPLGRAVGEVVIGLFYFYKKIRPQWVTKYLWCITLYAP